MKLNYEERALIVLSRWMGGESLRKAAEELAVMAREESDRSYEEGYRFAKEESRLVEEAVEAFV